MSLTRPVGGPPKNLPPSDLHEFITALEQSEKVYEALSDEEKNALSQENYPNLFRGNLADARRAQLTPDKKATSARSVAEGTTAGATIETLGSEAYTFAAPSHMFTTQLQLRSEFPGTNEGLYEASVTGIRCLKCFGRVIPLQPCRNCGHNVYALGTTPNGIAGLFCNRCNKGFTYLTCSCGCENPVSGDTLMKLKAKSGGCFIVTAASGDANSVEVLYLTAFRDSTLAGTSWGSKTISMYYALSPPLARLIASSPVRRRLVLHGLIRPLIWLFRFCGEVFALSRRRGAGST